MRRESTTEQNHPWLTVMPWGILTKDNGILLVPSLNLSFKGSLPRTGSRLRHSEFLEVLNFGVLELDLQTLMRPGGCRRYISAGVVDGPCCFSSALSCFFVLHGYSWCSVFRTSCGSDSDRLGSTVKLMTSRQRDKGTRQQHQNTNMSPEI